MSVIWNQNYNIPVEYYPNYSPSGIINYSVNNVEYTAHLISGTITISGTVSGAAIVSFDNNGITTVWSGFSNIWSGTIVNYTEYGYKEPELIISHAESQRLYVIPYSGIIGTDTPIMDVTWYQNYDIPVEYYPNYSPSGIINYSVNNTSYTGHLISGTITTSGTISGAAIVSFDNNGITTVWSGFSNIWSGSVIDFYQDTNLLISHVESGRIYVIPYSGISKFTIISGGSTGGIQSASSTGTGYAIYNSQTGNNLVFNTISGAGGISITSNSGLIEISGGSTGLTYSGTSPIIVSGSNISIYSGSSIANGYISSGDWITFNNKQASGNYAPAGNYLISGVSNTDALLEGSTNLYYSNTLVDGHLSGTSPIVYLNGNISLSGTLGTVYSGISPINVSGSNISIQSGSSIQNGYISSGDWTIFNNKQASGSYITSGTGFGNVSIVKNGDILEVSGTQYVLPSNVVQSASSSGVGQAIYNSQVGSGLIFNTISGIGLGVSYSNGVVYLSGSSASFTGGAITSDITPTTSGTLTIGTAALPFSGVNSNQYSTSVLSQTITGTTSTLDWNTGGIQKIDYTGGISGNCTLTFSNPLAGASYVYISKNNASGTTLNVFPTIKWQNGVSGVSTPTSGASDLYTFFYDGSSYYGNYSYNYI